MRVSILPNEKWYGGAAADGIRQPYTDKTNTVLTLAPNHTPNQCMPLLLSTSGRWLWNAGPFQIVFQEGTILCPDGSGADGGRAARGIPGSDAPLLPVRRRHAGQTPVFGPCL